MWGEGSRATSKDKPAADDSPLFTAAVHLQLCLAAAALSMPSAGHRLPTRPRALGEHRAKLRERAARPRRGAHSNPCSRGALSRPRCVQLDPEGERTATGVCERLQPCPGQRTAGTTACSSTPKGSAQQQCSACSLDPAGSAQQVQRAQLDPGGERTARDACELKRERASRCVTPKRGRAWSCISSYF